MKFNYPLSTFGKNFLILCVSISLSMNYAKAQFDIDCLAGFNPAPYITPLRQTHSGMVPNLTVSGTQNLSNLIALNGGATTFTSKNIRINVQNLNVNLKVTFVNCKISLASGSNLTVTGSATTLTFQNCSIFTHGAASWQGIRVNDGGKLNFVGTRLEDADVAVTANKGRLSVINTTFSRNATCIVATALQAGTTLFVHHTNVNYLNFDDFIGGNSGISPIGIKLLGNSSLNIISGSSTFFNLKNGIISNSNGSVGIRGAKFIGCEFAILFGGSNITTNYLTAKFCKFHCNSIAINSIGVAVDVQESTFFQNGDGIWVYQNPLDNTVTIRRNYFEANENVAISIERVLPISGNTDKTDITENTIKNFSHAGIEILTVDGAELNGGLVQLNPISIKRSITSNPLSAPIYISNGKSKGFHVKSNIITLANLAPWGNTPESGIRIRSTIGSNNSVEGNMITSSGYTIGSSILVQESPLHKICANIVDGSAKGLDFTGNCPASIIGQNTLMKHQSTVPNNNEQGGILARGGAPMIGIQINTANFWTDPSFYSTTNSGGAIIGGSIVTSHFRTHTDDPHYLPPHSPAGFLKLNVDDQRIYACSGQSSSEEEIKSFVRGEYTMPSQNYYDYRKVATFKFLLRDAPELASDLELQSFVQSFASTPEGALVLADYAYSDAMKSTSSPEIDALLEEIRLIRLEMNQLLENTVELTESEVEWLEQKMADLHDLESNLEPLVNLLKLEKLNWTEIFLNQIIDISPSTLFGQYYKTFCLGVCEKTMTGDLPNLHDEILDIAKLCEKEFGTLPAFAGTLLMREERLLAMSISQEDNCMPQTSEKTTSTSFAHITDGEILSWKLFDSYGRLITEGANKFSKLSAQGFIRVTGCYFLQKQTTNGSITEKVFFTKLN
jgi:hypothetical protein